MMFDSVFLVCNYRTQIDIFHTLKNISLYIRVRFFQFCDQVLDLHPFGCTASIRTAGTACLGKPAGALQKMQMIVISPMLDIIFPYQIQRTNQLHPLKIRAVQLWHHGLYLRTIQHSHQDCFNHIIIVVSKCDLVASKFFCLTVEMPSSHSGT